MFAAGAALPGHGSAVALLAGPVVACAGIAAVLRARRLTRRLDGARGVTSHSPLDDLARLVHSARVPQLGTGPLLAAVTALAAVGAFARDTAEHASAGGAATTAGIEALAVVVCFLVLGRPLGLWPERP